MMANKATSCHPESMNDIPTIAAPTISAAMGSNIRTPTLSIRGPIMGLVSALDSWRTDDAQTKG
jgi:hypothetical protein